MPIKKTVFYLSILGSLLIALLASFGYGGTFEKYLLLPFYVWMGIALLPALFLRLPKKATFLEARIYPWHFGFFCFTLALSIASVLTSFLIYPNFFFAQFHLDPYAFYFLPLLLYVLFYFYQKKFKQHWRLMAFLGPILLILLGALTRTKGYGVFLKYFADEDTWVEYAQFIFYLLTSFISLKTAFLLKKRSSILLAIFLTIALGFFVVAGEEISWGQRIFGIVTPEEIAKNNTQGELNLHNNDKIFGYVYRAYLLIAAYGAFAWLFKVFFLDRFFKRWQKIYDLFIPHWQWSSVFLFSFIMFYLHRMKNYYNLQVFEEFNELIFSWGLLAFFSEDYWRTKKQLKNEKK